MFGVIKRNPVLPLRDLFEVLASRTMDLEDSAAETYSHTGYSRFALYNFLKLLHLDDGSRVLLPAYICDVVLLPFTELALEPVYYGVTDRFQIDFSTVRLSPKTKAIITVNYFGMSQDFDAIKSFVSEHQLVWINDNSHGFASSHGERKLELFGDFSITSFRKVLPTLNGARARINNEVYSDMRSELSRLNRPAATESKLLRFLAATLLGNLHYRPWRHPDYSDVMAHSEEDIMAFSLDRRSGSVLRMTAEKYIQERRYHLYQAVDSFLLQEQYEFLEPVPGLLQPGNSPMVYPLMVEDQRHWKAILRASRVLGIDIHTWPSMPREVIAGDLFGSVTRWQQLLFLPINQDLNAIRYCSRLAEVFDSVPF